MDWHLIESGATGALARRGPESSARCRFPVTKECPWACGAGMCWSNGLAGHNPSSRAGTHTASLSPETVHGATRGNPSSCALAFV